MKPQVLIASLLVMGGLAGCLGKSGGNDPGEPAGGPGEETATLEATGCREQVGIFPMTDAAVRPYLPDGFEPLPPAPPEIYPDTDPSSQSATLLLVGLACTEPEGTSVLFPFLPVLPPEEMRVEGVYYHAVALPCTGDAGTVDVLAAWEVPCGEGTMTIKSQAEASAGAAWTLEAAGSDATVTLDGAAPASSTPAGPEWIRLFHASDQQVCAVTDLRVEVHEHWQFGATVLGVSGSPTFPVPGQPGLASLGMPGFAMDMTRVLPQDPGGMAGACA